MKKILTTMIVTAMFFACNDVSVGTDKGGPAEAFFNRFDNDNPTVARYALSVRLSHADRGTVTITPAPTPPDSLYDDGTAVTLEAAPIAGKPYVFSGWIGTAAGEDGASPTTTINMNGNRIITANFAIHPLVCGDRQAWVDNITSTGVILRENGEFVSIIRMGGVWVADNDPGVETRGTWSVNGNTLQIGTRTYGYTVDVNATPAYLTLTQAGSAMPPTSYTREGGINVE